MPFVPSLTSISLDAFNRSASGAVKPGGMCCAITIGDGKFFGKRGTMRDNATGPPVDVPIATHSERPCGPGFAAGGDLKTALRAPRTKRAHLLEQLVAERRDLEHARTRRRLGDEIDGTDVQCFERNLRALRRQRAHHDYGRALRSARDDTAQRFQTADAAHFDVHSDDVGRERLDERDAFFTVFGGADDLDSRTTFQHAPQHMPHKGRIVDDDDANRSFARHPYRIRGLATA